MEIAKNIFKTLFYILIFIGCYILISYFGISIVSGQSMEPTLHNNDVIIHSNYPSTTDNLKINDIIIADTPPDIFGQDELIVKRIVGLPNDTIEIKNNVFYRNGKAVNENYIKEVMNSEDFSNIPAITLKSNEYYIMGDNRNHSTDSRYFGPISKDTITSKVVSYNSSLTDAIKSLYKKIGRIKDK